MRFLMTLIASALMVTGGLTADDRADELLDVMQFDKTYELMFSAEQDDVASEMVPVYNAYRTIFTKYVSPEALKAFMRDMYNETFTPEELEGLVAFYRTELGQKCLRTMPQLGQKVMRYTQEVLLAHLDELKELLAEAAE